jgi:hypothetical protein
MAMAEAWTVSEARTEFAKTGIPIDGLDRIIRALPGFRPIGEVRKPPGSQGGRGDRLYEIGQLQRLHAALAPWLAVPPSGDT